VKGSSLLAALLGNDSAEIFNNYFFAFLAGFLATFFLVVVFFFAHAITNLLKQNVW